MDKKKITVITISVLFFLILGVGFNSIFSKANKNEADKVNNNKVTKVQSIENKETEKIEKESDIEKVEQKKEIDNVKVEQKNDEVLNKNYENSQENNLSKENDFVENINQDNNEDNTLSVSNESSQQVQEPEKKDTVTLSISCNTAINKGLNNENGFTHLASNGVILATSEVEIEEGETVFEVLQKTVLAKDVHMEYTGSGSTIYIQGIDNLYEFDGGQNSGWMYSVNGWYPNYGCGVYKLKANDVIQWNYTCDLGNDLGANVR